jgi:hypothetical protein
MTSPLEIVADQHRIADPRGYLQREEETCAA